MCLVHSPRFVYLRVLLFKFSFSSTCIGIFGEYLVLCCRLCLFFWPQDQSSFTRTYAKIEYQENGHQYVQTVPKLKNRAKDLDSKTKIARLSQHEVLRTCEPPSFWESVMAVFILLRVLERMS